MIIPQILRLHEGQEGIAQTAVKRLKDPGKDDRSGAGYHHLRDLLSNDANYFFVALEDETPVGFLIAYRVPRIDRDADMIYLYEIVVEERLRRRGIGSAMIEALKEDCVGRNIMKIWVGTEIDNLPARRLYESTEAVCNGDGYAEYVYQDLESTSA